MSKRWTYRDIQRLKDGQTEEAKPSKYRNVKTVVDGETFDSRKEADRWAQLKILERAGIIHNLRRQVSYRLEIAGQLICTYRADFVYNEAGCEIIEDSKGMKTKDFIIKEKLMLALHNIKIKIT